MTIQADRSPTARHAVARGLVATILVASLLLAGCGSGSDGASVGSTAPPVAGTTLDGAAFDLASLRGRPVVVNFWASWCTPCRNEFPVLADALAAHEADGMALVGVLFKDDPDPATTFVTEFGAAWPTVDDPDDSIAAAYRVVAPPQTYFIDGDGVVQGIHIGELLAEDFDRQWAKIAP